MLVLNFNQVEMSIFVEKIRHFVLPRRRLLRRRVVTVVRWREKPRFKLKRRRRGGAAVVFLTKRQYEVSNIQSIIGDLTYTSHCWRTVFFTALHVNW